MTFIIHFLNISLQLVMHINFLANHIDKLDVAVNTPMPTVSFSHDLWTLDYFSCIRRSTYNNAQRAQIKVYFTVINLQKALINTLPTTMTRILESMQNMLKIHRIEKETRGLIKKTTQIKQITSSLLAVSQLQTTQFHKLFPTTNHYSSFHTNINELDVSYCQAICMTVETK